MRTRELDKRTHDYGVLSRKYQTVSRRNAELERQVEEMKQSLRILNDVQARNVNLTIMEKNKSSMMAKRMDLLEKNILSMKEPEKLFNAPDSMQKIRNTLNALIKENQELRKKIKEYKNEIHNRDRELNKLENKNSNLETRFREMVALARSKSGLKMASVHISSQYHRVELVRSGFFAPEQSSLADQQDPTRGLAYKTNILQERFWKLLADISEYGSQTFAANTLEQREEEKKMRLEFLTDQYLSYRDLCERLNSINSLCVSVTIYVNST